jgi:hypothetical protein
MPKQELIIERESEPEFLYGTKIMGVDGGAYSTPQLGVLKEVKVWELA